ncbi:MAG TPA: peroxiredoxin family protein [Acidothermaceae bacterium]|jgi:peroxiredoxin
MTSRTARRHDEHRREALAALREQQTRQARRVRRRNIAVATLVAIAVAAVVSAMMLSSKPTSSSATRVAPDFTLTDTAGQQVHLAAYRGHTVVLYFSEGAGCGSCLQQMSAIEKDRAAFDRAGVTVLPIVMNTRAQITSDMRTYGVTTPFLLDDGAVSTAYKTIGHGMHAGLPGHSFVLIDKDGVQRWYGEYPSMYLAPSDLLAQVSKHLG